MVQMLWRRGVEIYREDKNFWHMVFFCSAIFVLYFTLGNLLMRHTRPIQDVIFGTDSARVFGDLIKVDGNHYRLKVHPFFVLLSQPWAFLSRGIFLHANIAIIFLEAVLAALSAGAIKMILDEIVSSEWVAWLFGLIFAASFSQFVLSTVIETFIFGGFFLTNWWLVALLLSKRRGKFTRSELALIVFFAVGCFGSTITNYCWFCVGLLYLVLQRYTGLRSRIGEFVRLNVLNFCVFIGADLWQRNVIWHRTTPHFWSSYFLGFCIILNPNKINVF